MNEPVEYPMCREKQGREMIQIATDKKEYLDYNAKHGSKAKYGWYRYDTRFGLLVYRADESLERYNIFTTRMLVRCDKDRKLYLYDFVRTRKKRANRMSHKLYGSKLRFSVIKISIEDRICLDFVNSMIGKIKRDSEIYKNIKK